MLLVWSTLKSVASVAHFLHPLCFLPRHHRFFPLQEKLPRISRVSGPLIPGSLDQKTVLRQPWGTLNIWAVPGCWWMGGALRHRAPVIATRDPYDYGSLTGSHVA